MLLITIIVDLIGFIIAIKASWEMYVDYRFKRHAHKCMGTVTYKDMLDEKHEIFASSVQFTFKGEEHELDTVGGNYFVGGEFPILYNDILEEVRYGEDVSNALHRHLKDLVIAGIFLTIGYYMFIQEHEAMSFKAALWLIVVTIAGGCLLYGGIVRYVKSRTYIKSPNYHITKAKVVELIPHTVYDVYGGEGTIYYLLYEFEEDGVKKQMRSSTGSSKNMLKVHEGDEVNIMYDMTTGVADKVNVIWEHIITWVISIVVGVGMIVYVASKLIMFYQQA